MWDQLGSGQERVGEEDLSQLSLPGSEREAGQQPIEQPDLYGPELGPGRNEPSAAGWLEELTIPSKIEWKRLQGGQ